MNNEINLMPEKAKHTASNLKKHYVVHYVAIGLLFIISFSSVVLFMLIALSPLPSLVQREKDETKRLSFFSEMIVKLQFTKNRVNHVNDILKLRPDYSESIDKIKNQLSENAVIEEIHLSEKVLSVTIVSPSLSVLDQFITHLTEENAISKYYKKITLVSLHKDFEKGRFVMTLELI